MLPMQHLLGNILNSIDSGVEIANGRSEYISLPIDSSFCGQTLKWSKVAKDSSDFDDF